MPAHVVERIADALNNSGKALQGSRIQVVGVSYKEDVRESPAIGIMHLLVQKRLSSNARILLFSDSRSPGSDWNLNLYQNFAK